ncbi:MAG: hypothetical protein AUG51_10750 [Acidobacteria bacterium 13_1_20CM_3_53_8]|nr:MAG: hypothetical protein AUG51_10750 [Acidobacteria bacterium 13_1_20CM_3_53_8]
MNRKLIRTTLADVKAKSRDVHPHRDKPSNSGAPSRPSGGDSAQAAQARAAAAAAAQAVQVRKRTPPATETHAELFYYKKQIDAHTLMVIVLLDGEEIEGTIEWYDKSALKVNRKSAPNLLLLKHNIKYMFKAEDRESK